MSKTWCLKPGSSPKLNHTWNEGWKTYTGRCRVITYDTSVVYGKVKNIFPKKCIMEILTDRGEIISTHPRYVWPVEWDYVNPDNLFIP